jgi:hypothetical protein
LPNAWRVSRVARLLQGPHQPLARPDVELGGQPLKQFVGVHARVPDVDVAGSGELRHRVPVPGTGGDGEGAALLATEALLAGRDHEAGDQPLDVVLERSGERLVEVVGVEHQPSFR